MTLLVFMYHRARAGRHGNAVEMLDHHFAVLARYANVVLPGERLVTDRPNVCLSFDDATYDFYSRVFPLLEKHRLTAVLAVPTAFVREHASGTASHRETIETDHAFAHPEAGGFCTWPELRQLAATGRVAIAAHGHTHCRLDRPESDLVTEIDGPGRYLHRQLGHPVSSFVFPYGRFSATALCQTCRSYRHAFRIGGSANTGWNAHLLYRIDADSMTGPADLLSPGRLLQYRARRYWNLLRGR